MAFLENPQIVPRSATTASAILRDFGSSRTWWNTSGSSSITAGVLTLATNQKRWTPLSRVFSPFCNDLQLDVSWEFTPGTGTSIFRVGVTNLSSIFLSGAAIQFEVDSANNISLTSKDAGAINSGTTTTLEPSQLLAYEPRRMELILRKESWTDETAGSAYELRLYDSVDVLQTTLTGNHNLDWKTWTVANTSNPDDVGDVHAAVSFEFATGGGSDSVAVSDFNPTYVNQTQTIDTVFGPIPDGMSMEHPDLPTAQTRSEWGILDPTLAPFSADGTGVTESTAELQECIHWAKDYSCVTWLPSGSEIKINDTLNSRQMVYQRSSSSATNRNSFVDEFRPVCIMGSNNSTMPKITLADSSTGFTNGTNLGTAKVMIVLDTTDYKPKPPAGTVQNANYNQQLINVHMDLGNNAGAIGCEIIGAQGVEAVHCKVTGTSFFAGMYNLPSAGGGLATFDVTGGQYGVYFDATLPAPPITGSYFVNQSVSAIRSAATGNRQCLVLCGVGIDALAGTTAIDLSGSADTDATTFNPQRGQVALIDCYIDFASVNVGNVLLKCNRSVYMQNVYVRNCAELVDHVSAPNDISSPNSSGWVHIRQLVIPYDPPTFAYGGFNTTLSGAGRQTVSPANYPYDAANWINDVRSTTNIETYGTEGVSPPTDLVTRWRIPDNFPTWENATIDVAVDYSTTPDGLTDNSAAIDSALAAATAGDTIFFRKGYWRHDDVIDFPAGVNVCGTAKKATHFLLPQSPGASVPFGANDTARPILRTATSDSSNWAFFNVWPCFDGVTAADYSAKQYAVNWRCSGKTFCIRTRRDSYWGFGSYPGTADNSMIEPLWQFTDNAGDSIHYHLNEGQGDNAADPYCHFYANGVTGGTLNFVQLNGEHVYDNPAQAFFENCDFVRVIAYKGESNYPAIKAKNCGEFHVYGVGGNHSGFIPDGVLPTGETEDIEQLDYGYNPEPANYPAGLTPTMIVIENCTGAIVVQTQEEPRFNGSHPVFGGGTRPDFWKFINRVDGVGVEQHVVDYGDRPTLWQYGTVTIEPTRTLSSSPGWFIDSVCSFVHWFLGR